VEPISDFDDKPNVLKEANKESNKEAYMGWLKTKKDAKKDSTAKT
jgi:hypothetical protein